MQKNLLKITKEDNEMIQNNEMIQTLFNTSWSGHSLCGNCKMGQKPGSFHRIKNKEQGRGKQKTSVTPRAMQSPSSGVGSLRVDLVLVDWLTSYTSWAPGQAEQFQGHFVVVQSLVMSDSLWPLDCNMPGLFVLHYLLELAQSHVHWVSDAIQPSHPLLSTPPSAFNLSQHQGLFQWVDSSRQVAKVLEHQLQHQPFQWIFRIDFL